jgi:3-methyladenine DNA glycosylase AlkD
LYAGAELLACAALDDANRWRVRRSMMRVAGVLDDAKSLACARSRRTVQRGMTIESDLRARLPALVDRAYLAQITRLVPGAKLLGVRVPALRGLARELDRGHSLDDEAAIALLHRLAKRHVREELLVGVFLIAQKKRRIARVTWKDLDAWVDAIDNWEVCDQLAMGIAKYRLDDEGEMAIDRLVTWAKSPSLWRRRFAVATVATAGLAKREVERVLAVVASDRAPMVKKAVAWARRELRKPR